MDLLVNYGIKASQVQAELKEVDYVSFDGVNDYGMIPLSTNNVTSHTTSFWVYITENTSNPFICVNYSTTRNFGLIGCSNSPNQNGNKVFYHFVRSGTDSSTNRISGSTINDFPINQWYHITSVMGSNGNRIYVNGVEETISYSRGNESTTDSWSTIAGGSGANRFHFGVYVYDGGPQFYTPMKLAEFAFYTADIGESNIVDVYENGVDINNANLRNYILFDEGSGTSFADSKTATTGTLYNGATFGTEIFEK